jgi:hypothetical protein
MLDKMKKFITLIFAVLAAIAANAQERTVYAKLDLGAYAKTYYATVSDTLKPTTQDTIDLVFQYRGNQYVKKLSIRTRFDKIIGADTTVKVTVDGKEFLDDASWVSIIGSTTSSAVTTNDVIQVLNSDYSETVASYQSITQAVATANSDTTVYAAHTITPLDKTYQWYRVRYILSGNDSVGTGIKLDEVQIALYVE